MATGVASIPGMSIGSPRTSANVDNMTFLGIFRSLFDQYRQLGQAAAPGLLLPVLIAQTHGLLELSKGAAPRTRQDLLILASRYAEYVGWLVQETGDEPAALWWARRAVDLAKRAALGHRLKEINAELDACGNVQFTTLGYDSAVRTYFWTHLPELHEHIRDWVGKTAGSANLADAEREAPSQAIHQAMPD
jgi:hypothetical protein